MEFRWNDWNRDHIAAHGMNCDDAEYVINNARRPYPEMKGRRKRFVIGQAHDGTYAQVVYVLDDDGTAFVIHCRPLTESEKHRYRRRIR